MTPVKWRIWPLISDDMIYVFPVIHWTAINYECDDSFGTALASLEIAHDKLHSIKEVYDG